MIKQCESDPRSRTDPRKTSLAPTPPASANPSSYSTSPYTYRNPPYVSPSDKSCRAYKTWRKRNPRTPNTSPPGSDTYSESILVRPSSDWSCRSKRIDWKGPRGRIARLRRGNLVPIRLEAWRRRWCSWPARMLGWRSCWRRIRRRRVCWRGRLASPGPFAS